MRRHGIVIGIVMGVVLVFSQRASAIECQTSRQGGDSHWAWRLIDGRKCWYRGAVGMDKSLLHWTDAGGDNGLLDRPRSERAKGTAEPAPQAVDAVARQPAPSELTFDDRWRLLR
jgi:hypothetical protein